MPTIDNHNCKGLCSQKYCDKEEVYLVNINIHGLMLILPLCKEHYDEYVGKITTEVARRHDLKLGVKNE